MASEVCRLSFEKCELRRLMATDLSVDLSVSQSDEFSVGGFCLPIEQSSIPIYESVALADKQTVKLDVNQDGLISPMDVDLILDRMNYSNSIGPLQAEVDSHSSLNLDIDDDGIVTAKDALVVMNRVHWYRALVPCTCAGCLASAVVDGTN